jgi:hypothetical protein
VGWGRSKCGGERTKRQGRKDETTPSFRYERSVEVEVVFGG